MSDTKTKICSKCSRPFTGNSKIETCPACGTQKTIVHKMNYHITVDDIIIASFENEDDRDICIDALEEDPVDYDTRYEKKNS